VCSLNPNPYESPNSECAPVVFTDCVRQVERGWLRRKIHLGSPIDAVVEYRGRSVGYETVLVNDEVASRPISWVWFIPHFDFAIPTKSGELAASLDVRVSPWLTIRHMTLYVEGELVYAEGR